MNELIVQAIAKGYRLIDGRLYYIHGEVKLQHAKGYPNGHRYFNFRYKGKLKKINIKKMEQYIENRIAYLEGEFARIINL